MQIMYVVSFLLMLFVLLLTQARDDAALVENDSTAIAQAMVLWHSVATKECADTPCPGGIVDVFNNLPPAVKAGPAFASSPTAPRFISRYDNVNGTLVTYMPAASAVRSSVSFGTVNGALAEMAAKRGETSHLGHWDSATGKVIFGILNSGAERSKSLPSPFMGGIIPDGSPVMLGTP